MHIIWILILLGGCSTFTPQPILDAVPEALPVHLPAAPVTAVPVFVPVVSEPGLPRAVLESGSTLNLTLTKTVKIVKAVLADKPDQSPAPFPIAVNAPDIPEPSPLPDPPGGITLAALGFEIRVSSHESWATVYKVLFLFFSVLIGVKLTNKLFDRWK